MRRLLGAGVLAVMAMAAIAGGPPPASADLNTHSCAGYFSSAGPITLGGDFGAAVAGVAEAQGVDNIGLANCGDTAGQNP